MTTALTLLLVVLLVGLLLFTSASPNSARHSAFELKRRRALGDNTTLDELRANYLVDTTSFLRIVQALFLVLMLPVMVGLFGMVLGIVVGVLTAILYGAVSRLRPLRRLSQRLYDEQELNLLTFIHKYKNTFRALRYGSASTVTHGFDSKAELEHLIEHAGHVLSEDEKRLLVGSLRFDDRLVGEVMTPKKHWFTITKNEILGPLVLDDLHRSGHESFPVVNGGGTDDVVGILRLRDVQTLDTTRRHTAKVETAMDPDIRFVGSDESLATALNLLLDSQHHMLIVTDGHATVGMVTLSDIIKTLFGKNR
jgi:CBS domain containing-hemolysin-like protein